MTHLELELTGDGYLQIEEELANLEIHGNRTDEDIAKLKDL
ncbi:hypothetical protein [Oceanobacillus profundus]